MKIEKRKVDVNARIVNLLADVYVENGCAKVKISFKNYHSETIKAVKFLLKGFNSFSEEVLVDGKNEFIITVQDLSVEPSASVQGIIVDLPNTEIRKIEIVPFQICYENDVIAEIEPPQFVEYEIECLELIYTEDKIIEREQLLCLRKQNEKAVCYPREDENSWICVCGHYNKKSAGRCSNCGDKKKKIFENCTKDAVIKKCETELEQKNEKQRREEERKRQEEERELEYNIKQEQLRRQRKQFFKIAGISLIVAIIFIASIWRISYVKKYGMDHKTYAQWKSALKEYEDWKDNVQMLFFGENGFYDKIKDSEKKYTINEIYSMSSLEKPRKDVLNKVGEIGQITGDFPERYQEIFSKICDYQKLYYIMRIEVTTISCLTDDFFSNTYNRTKELEKEIKRLEKYLNDKYLHIENVKFRDDINMSYSPYTFKYKYSDGDSYSSSTMPSEDLSDAKKVADEYCEMLMKKHSNIKSITYTGNSTSFNESADFEYRVVFEGITRIGTVHVRKQNGSFKVTEMDFED